VELGRPADLPGAADVSVGVAPVAVLAGHLGDRGELSGEFVDALADSGLAVVYMAGKGSWSVMATKESQDSSAAQADSRVDKRSLVRANGGQ
jgi:hypothetical protein